MRKVIVTLSLLLACAPHYAQVYKKHYSKNRHAAEIISVVATDSIFATSGYDKSVIVSDYEGRTIYRYKITQGKINSLSFIPNSKMLLIGLTESENNETVRHVIRCLDASGKPVFELIDKRLKQEYVDIEFEANVETVRNAIDHIKAAFPELNIKTSLNVPQVNLGLSHIELIQSIAASPNSKTIASIDKFNILKIWNEKHEVQSSFKILNNKKDTNIYFRSDSTIFIEPNIILNIRDTTVQGIPGFERHAGVPFNSAIYFHFNYNNESRPEVLYDVDASHSRVFDSSLYYTKTGTQVNDWLALLGVDGLIRLINKEGEIISTFGKDRNELITFRGEKIQLLSKISQIGSSPNGKFIISGDEEGKVIIWKQE